MYETGHQNTSSEQNTGAEAVIRRMGRIPENISARFPVPGGVLAAIHI